MKSLIKKNQLMITALAIMIAIAGYLQFAGSGMEEDYLKTDDSNVKTGDASPVDSEGVITENYTLDGLLDLSEEDLLKEQTDIESLDTDGGVIVDDYLDAGMAPTARPRARWQETRRRRERFPGRPYSPPQRVRRCFPTRSS